VVAWGDCSLAGAGRTGAQLVGAELAGRGVPIWFEGHWGFQYYMERHGGQAVDLEHPQCRPGDYLVLPSNNSSVVGVPPGLRWEIVHSLQPPSCRWVTTMNRDVRAGFYADYMGPLPFVFGDVPPEEYNVLELKPPLTKKPPRGN